MKDITPELLADALRAADPEPYDGEHESLYYENFSQSLFAELAVRGPLRMNKETQ